MRIPKEALNRSSVAAWALVVTITVAGCGGVVKANRNAYNGSGGNGGGGTGTSPIIASVLPNSGDVAGGTSVTITGTNFVAGALVLFGTTSAPHVTVNSATQIQVVTPPRAAGLVDVTVRNPDGQSGMMPGAFTYTSSGSGGPPSITGVSPNSGSAGATVTINGTNFKLAARVAFGSTNASVTFLSSTQLAAAVPAIPDGTYDVTVTNPDPASTTLNNGFTVATDPPLSHDGLLSGCTVSEATNRTSCTPPNGWTIIAQDGFGGGQLHIPSESLHGPNYDGVATHTSTVRAHTGSYGLIGDYSSDGDVINVGINTTVIASAPFNDLYLSYWDWEDSNALIPAEIGIAGWKNCDGCANQQEFGWDWSGQFLGDGKSSRSNPMLAVSNCLGANCNGSFYYPPGDPSCADQGSVWCRPPYPGNQDAGSADSLAINAGSWRQYEIWWHPNTVTNGVANPDGFLRLYVNGALTQSISHYAPAGLRGTGSGAQTPTMQNPNPNGFIEIGGVITAFCGVNQDQGRAVPFSVCPVYAPTSFHRAIDDVIIMKK